MTDDLLIRPGLRRMVVSVAPVTFGPSDLLELQRVIAWCDALRIRNARLEERLKLQEERIDRLRTIVGLHRAEVENLQTLTFGAMAERDSAVLERDQATAELHATEGHLAVLRAELDRARAEVPA